MTNPPLRVALLGYGLGGRSFHAPIIAVTPGLRLSAIVTGDPGRRAAAASEHAGARVLDTAEQVFDAARNFDLVVISTPNRTHVPLARSALEAGLAVVVDKPMAPTAHEAKRLVDDARRRGLFLTVYQNRRWDGDFLTLRRLIADGELGDVYRFESRLDRWRPQPRGGWRELADPVEGGGLLFDLGSHLIDQALVLFGPVTAVHAELDRRRPGQHVDDDTFVALTHASGVRSHLWTTVLAATTGARFRVLGSRAAFTKLGTDVQEAALRGGLRPDQTEWGAEPRELWGTLGVGENTRVVPTERGAYPRFYAEVARALRDGTPPPVDPADAVSTLEVIESARAAGSVIDSSARG